MTNIWKLLIGKSGKKYEEMKFVERMVVDLRDLIIIAVLFFAIIQPLIISSYYVPTSSMEPTIMENTRLIGLPIIYGGYIPKTNIKMPSLKKIHRGDIIIFKYPKNPKVPYVKRVIGLPGDTVEVIGKIVYVNGKPLKEDYTQFIMDPFYESNPSIARPNYGPYHVPENSLFVMGDNRDNSADSRFWGYVPLKNVFAAPLITYWSYDKQKHKIRWDHMFKLLINK